MRGRSSIGAWRLKAGQGGKPSPFLVFHMQVGFGLAAPAQPGLGSPTAAAFAGLSSVPSPGLLAHFAHSAPHASCSRSFTATLSVKLSQTRPCLPSPCPSLLLQCSKIPTPGCNSVGASQPVYPPTHAADCHPSDHEAPHHSLGIGCQVFTWFGLEKVRTC